jgi:hypothetical protein
MSASYELFAIIELTASQQQVSLTGIPQDADELVVHVSARSTTDDIVGYFGTGDVQATEYNSLSLVGTGVNGQSLSGVSSTIQINFPLAGNGYNTGYYSNVLFSIPGYATSQRYKVFTIEGVNGKRSSGNALRYVTGSLDSGVGTLNFFGFNFAAGSIFRFYKLKGI